MLFNTHTVPYVYTKLFLNMKNTRIVISDDKEKPGSKTMVESKSVESKNKTIEEKRLKLALDLRKF